MARSVPPKLYKFQPYNVQTLDNLKNQVLWFSKPAQFNDPFDCKVIPSKVETLGEEDWRTLYVKMQKAAAAAKKDLPYTGPDGKFRAVVKEGIAKTFGDIVTRLQQHGVACFSAKSDDFLMWSHYAEGHRGFCLEFDPGYEPFSKARPVIYADSFPTLDAAEVAEVWVRGKPDPLMTFQFTKSSDWSYEQEWRIFHHQGNVEYNYNPAALSGIYLGCEMTEVHQEVVARLLAGFPTHLYGMQPSRTKFKVEAELIK
jgi:hypothetical protein